MKTEGQYIGAWDTASPELMIRQEEGAAFLKQHYSGKLNKRAMAVLSKVFGHPSVKQRYFAIPEPGGLLNEDPDARIARFTSESIKLSGQAAGKALRRTGLDIADVDALVVNTCTGYICPGLSTYLLESLGARRDARAYDLVGSGCGGAIPNLQLCQSLLLNGSLHNILSVSVEICSATFQMGNDLSLIISNALFGDGAAAAVVWDRPQGLRLLDSASRFAPEYREDIRFVHRGGQLHNQLSTRLPELASKTVGQVARDLLTRNRLTRDDISHWIIHPGGENVITAVRDELGLTDRHVSLTRQVLAEYGNMSSATVWFILRQAKPLIKAGENILMIAFGAGLSAHAYLLRS